MLAAVADPVRHALLRAVAKRGPSSVTDLADELGRNADAISKHLRVLREARVLLTVNPAGADARKQFHDVAAPFRGRDAAGKQILDFGAVILRLE